MFISRKLSYFFILAYLWYLPAFAVDYEGMVVGKIEVVSNEIPSHRIISTLGMRQGDVFSRDDLREGFRKIYRLGVFSDVRFDMDIYQEEGEDKILLTIIVKERYRVKKIKFIGNRKYGDSYLLEESPMQVGSYFTETLILRTERYIKDRYREDGYPATRIHPSTHLIPRLRQVEVTFDIEEAAEVLTGEIVFHNREKVKEKLLLRAMETKKDRWYREGKFDENILEEDKSLLVAAYRKKGYVSAKIDKVALSYQWRNPKKKRIRDVRIDIWVTEGEIYHFGETIIKGNQVFELEELQKNTQRKEGEIFNQEIHERDLAALTQMYHSRGYLFARIVPIERIDEATRAVHYVFDIYEGEKAHIEKIMVAGNTKTKSHVIRREVKVREGEIFSSTKVRRSLERLYNTQYFKNVSPEPQPGSVEGLINLLFRVEEQRTGLISAGVGYGTQSGFSLLFEMRERNLVGKGYSLGLNLNLGIPRQTLKVDFVEPYLFGKQIRTRVATSIAVIDRFLSTDRDPSTENVTTNSSGSITTNFQNFSIPRDALPTLYRDTIENALPYKSLIWSLGVDMGYSFFDYYSVSFGATYNLEREYWSNWRDRNLGVPKSQLQAYRENQEKFLNDPATERLSLQRDTIHTVLFGFTARRDSRDNILEPSRGSILLMDMDILTVNYQVIRWRFQAAWYQRIFWKFVFALGTDLFTLSSVGGRFDYPEDRYYTFYRDELRGWYEGNILSHRSELADRLSLNREELLARGGDRALGASKIHHILELRWTFIDRFLGGSFFWEAGNLHRSQLNPSSSRFLYDPRYYMYSFGIGLRVHIPQLPIRLYLAWRQVYNPDRRTFEFYQHGRDRNGAVKPDFIFTVGGFF